MSLLTILAALVIGTLFDLRYKKRWSTLFFQKTDHLIKDSTYYDIIYLGNSRVHFGINPYYVDSVTKLSSYNFGLGSSDAQEMMLVGSLYLQNHRPPKAVVMSIDHGAFVPYYSIKTRYPYFFYLNNDSVYKYVRLVYPAAPAMRILPFLKYSFLDEYNRTSLFVNGNPFPVFEHNIYRGFLNIHEGEKFNQNATFDMSKTDSIILSSQSKRYLQTLISNFQRAGSKIIIISPPEIPNSPDKKSGVHPLRDSLVNDLIQGRNIHHFHFRNSSSLESKYFTDEIHLSERGAKIFSVLLADSIKTIL